MSDSTDDGFETLHEVMRKLIEKAVAEGGGHARPVGFTIVIQGGAVPGGTPPWKLRGDQPEEPRTEVHESEDEIRVLAELPGVDMEHILLQVKDGALWIGASEEGRRYRGRVEVPGVDAESMACTVKHGVLEVVFRKGPAPGTG